MQKLLVGALFVGALAGGGISAQQKSSSLAIESMTGADLFKFYCALCHGIDGKGAGPVASALKTRPADLTTIARRNAGRFPREEIIAYVTSGARPIAAHGSPDMPVWGPTLWALDPSDIRVKMRIENLIDHVASIQALR